MSLERLRVLLARHIRLIVSGFNLAWIFSLLRLDRLFRYNPD